MAENTQPLDREQIDPSAFRVEARGGRGSEKIGRKEQQQAREQSQRLFDWQMGVSQEELATKRAGREAVMPRATALADAPGYSQQLRDRLERVTRNEGFSPEEESAMLQENVGAASSAFGKAREGMARRVAATGNAAGYYGGAAELAREESKAVGEATRRSKLAFADERRQRMLQNYGLTQQLEDEQQRRQEQGTNLLARLYGIDTGAFTSGRTAANAPMESYREAAYARSPWFDVATGALQGGGMALGGWLANR